MVSQFTLYCTTIITCFKIGGYLDGNESEAELAELEEKEALAIQQQMAQQLDEGDFGLDFITHLKVADGTFFY